MSSSKIRAPRILLPPVQPTLGIHSPVDHIAESRHVTDMAAVFAVCLCTANSGLGKKEEEQTDPITVASNSCLRKTFLYFEVILEEHVDQAADRHHDLPPLDSGAAN